MGIEQNIDFDSDPAKTHYRTIFLSDIHLGTKGCQADRLIENLFTTSSHKVTGAISGNTSQKSCCHW